MASPGSLQRVMPQSDHASVRKRLAKAVLLFQDQFLRIEEEQGSLCQVWLPEVSEDGSVVLQTKNLPFCVAGMGDLLALFRCISCRFCFGTNTAKPSALGAPGRVFTTGVPEASTNVQKYSKDVYLRQSEAQQCRIHSTLVVPLYHSPCLECVIGVLEVVQTAEDMPFRETVETLSRILEGCNLYTCKSSALSLEMDQSLEAAKSSSSQQKPYYVPEKPEAQVSSSSIKEEPPQAGPGFLGSGQEVDGPRLSPRLSLPPPAPATAEPYPPDALQSDLGHSDSNGSTKPDPVPWQSQAPLQYQNDTASACQPDFGNGFATSSVPSAPQQGGNPAAWPRAVGFGNGLNGGVHLQQVDMGAYRAEDESMDYDSDLMDEDEAEGPGPAARRKARGSGNPGKPGKRLRLEDLQSQFGVGLKEAAERLGICPTTLKRACRRHGIQRWPRRQLVKLSKAIDQMYATGGNASVPHTEPIQAPGGGKPLVVDNRWTTLAQLIPGMNHAGPGERDGQFNEVPAEPAAQGYGPANVQPQQQQQQQGFAPGGAPYGQQQTVQAGRNVGVAYSNGNGSQHSGGLPMQPKHDLRTASIPIQSNGHNGYTSGHQQGGSNPKSMLHGFDPYTNGFAPSPPAVFTSAPMPISSLHIGSAPQQQAQHHLGQAVPPYRNGYLQQEAGLPSNGGYAQQVPPQQQSYGQVYGQARNGAAQQRREYVGGTNSVPSSLQQLQAISGGRSGGVSGGLYQNGDFNDTAANSGGSPDPGALGADADLFVGVDDFDDDVGLVDAGVLEMLLAAQ